MFQIKLAFLSVIVAVSAFGEIPDRVNYEKFRDIHQTQAKALEKAKLELPPLRQALKEKEGVRKGLEAQNANLVAENLKGQQNIDARQTEIRTLEGQTGPNTEKIRTNTARLTQVAADNATIVPTIATKEGDVQKSSQAVKDSERTKAGAQNLVTQAEKSQTDHAVKVKGATTERDRIAVDLAKVTQAAGKVRSDLVEKNKALATADDQHKAAVTAFQQGTANIQTLTQNRNVLAKRKTELDAKPKKTPAEIQELTKITTTDLPLANRTLQTAVQGHQALGQRIVAMNAHIATLREQIRLATQDGLPKAEREVTRVQGELDASNNRLTPLVAIAAQLVQLVQTQKAALLVATTEHQRLVGVQTALSTELEGLKRRKTANDAETTRLTAENRTLQTQLDTQGQRIAALREAVRVLEVAGKQRLTQIATGEANLIPARAAELAASQAVVAAEARFQDADAKTTAANTQFQTVLAQYTKEKQGAQVKGQGEGTTAGSREGTERGTADGRAAGIQMGNPAGVREGDKDGKRRDYQAGTQAGTARGRTEGQTKGTADGKQDGQEAGTTAGFAEGQIEGEESGRKDGFRKGHDEGFSDGNNPQIRKRGYDQGYAFGVARARNQAATEDYPRGRTRVEQDWLNRPPQQKVEIEVNPSPVGPQARAVSSFETRLALVLTKLSQWLITDAIAAALDLGPVPQATPNYQYKQYAQNFDHPDFVQGYKSSYDGAYDAGFRAQYQTEYAKSRQTAYEAGYQSGYNTAFAVVHAGETTRGDSEGYGSAFASSYPTAYQTAQGAAYNRTFAEAKTKGTNSTYQSFFGEAKKQGERVGRSKGHEKAITEGRQSGDSDGYNNNIAVERDKAYESGRQEATAEYQNYYRPKLLSAGLMDASGGRLTAGKLATLYVVVRNFGAQPSPDTSLAIRVKDRLGNFPVTTDTSFLKSLPAGAEATFRNVIVGTPAGNNSGIQLDVDLIVDGFLVNTVTINQAVDQNFSLNLSEGNQVVVTNLTDREIPAGLRLLVSPESNDWSRALRFSAIPAKRAIRKIHPVALETEQVFVEALDADNKLIYRGNVTVPTSARQ